MRTATSRLQNILQRVTAGSKAVGALNEAKEQFQAKHTPPPSWIQAPDLTKRLTITELRRQKVLLVKPPDEGEAEGGRDDMDGASEAARHEISARMQQYKRAFLNRGQGGSSSGDMAATLEGAMARRGAKWAAEQEQQRETVRRRHNESLRSRYGRTKAGMGTNAYSQPPAVATGTGGDMLSRERQSSLWWLKVPTVEDVQRQVKREMLTGDLSWVDTRDALHSVDRMKEMNELSESHTRWRAEQVEWDQNRRDQVYMARRSAEAFVRRIGGTDVAQQAPPLSR